MFRVLFLLHGRWLRLKARVRQLYAWWFRPGDYWYDILSAYDKKLIAQLESGDWAGARITDERAGEILGLNHLQAQHAMNYGLRCRCGKMIWEIAGCEWHGA